MNYVNHNKQLLLLFSRYLFSFSACTLHFLNPIQQQIQLMLYDVAL